MRALLLVLLVGCSSSESTPSGSSTSSSSSSSSGGSNDASSGSNPDPTPQNDASAPVDSGSDASTGTFTLTSTAYANGAAIPDAQSCTGNSNKSPPLAWTGAPAGTKSFAYTFIDMSNQLTHAVSYDIPASRSSLPENVEKAYAPASVPGMHQTTAYDNNTRGYLGPCPPNQHTYVFTLYALDVDTLPGVTMATNRADATTAIKAHSLGTATLSGTYVKP